MPGRSGGSRGPSRLTSADVPLSRPLLLCPENRTLAQPSVMLTPSGAHTGGGGTNRMKHNLGVMFSKPDATAREVASSEADEALRALSGRQPRSQ